MKKDFATVDIYDKTLENAYSYIDSEELSKAEGEKNYRSLIGERLDRLVPILSEDDLDNAVKLNGSGKIPFVLHYGINGVTLNNISNSEFSPQQEDIVRETFESWNSESFTPDQFIDTIIGGGRQSGAESINIGVRSNSKASATGSTLILPAQQTTEALKLKTPPRDEWIKIIFRPMMKALISGSEVIFDADVLFHELVHIEQKEQNPISGLNSQEDAHLKQLQYELEAYHVGSRIRIAINKREGKDIAYDPHLQLTVESIRAKYTDIYSDEPFRSSSMLLDAFRRSGYPPERMLSDPIIIPGFDKRN